MSSNNPIQESIQETDSNKESQKPAISQSLEDSQESKKSEAHHHSPDEEEEGSAPPPKSNGTGAEDDGGGGRERLKRHRVEVAGRVWIPDMWGQEDLLKDWIDCTAFDAALVNTRIVMARDSLAKQARTTVHSTELRVQNGC